MPQKSNHDFKEKYPYVRVDTLVSLRITNILTKIARGFRLEDSFKNESYCFVVYSHELEINEIDHRLLFKFLNLTIITFLVFYYELNPDSCFKVSRLAPIWTECANP